MLEEGNRLGFEGEYLKNSIWKIVWRRIESNMQED
jgi:hypothetical protein